jgi:putative lipoic acid-binding regulatory protein
MPFTKTTRPDCEHSVSDPKADSQPDSSQDQNANARAGSESPGGETLLEFPCTFPIKAMGRSGSGLEAVVLEILQRHAPDFEADKLETRPSSGGKWLAVTVRIEATSKDQLDAIYRELSAHELVVYAL